MPASRGSGRSRVQGDSTSSDLLRGRRGSPQYRRRCEAEALEALRRLETSRAHPEACVLIDERDEDWSKLWWGRLRGRAMVLEAGPSTSARSSCFARSTPVRRGSARSRHRRRARGVAVVVSRHGRRGGSDVDSASWRRTSTTRCHRKRTASLTPNQRIGPSCGLFRQTLLGQSLRPKLGERLVGLAQPKAHSLKHSVCFGELHLVVLNDLDVVAPRIPKVETGARKNLDLSAL